MCIILNFFFPQRPTKQVLSRSSNFLVVFAGEKTKQQPEKMEAVSGSKSKQEAIKHILEQLVAKLYGDKIDEIALDALIKEHGMSKTKLMERAQSDYNNLRLLDVGIEQPVVETPRGRKPTRDEVGDAAEGRSKSKGKGHHRSKSRPCGNPVETQTQKGDPGDNQMSPTPRRGKSRDTQQGHTPRDMSVGRQSVGRQDPTTWELMQMVSAERLIVVPQSDLPRLTKWERSIAISEEAYEFKGVKYPVPVTFPGNKVVWDIIVPKQILVDQNVTKMYMLEMSECRGPVKPGVPLKDLLIQNINNIVFNIPDGFEPVWNETTQRVLLKNTASNTLYMYNGKVFKEDQKPCRCAIEKLHDGHCHQIICQFKHKPLVCRCNGGRHHISFLNMFRQTDMSKFRIKSSDPNDEGSDE